MEANVPLQQLVLPLVMQANSHWLVKFHARSVHPALNVLINREQVLHFVYLVNIRLESNSLAQIVLLINIVMRLRLLIVLRLCIPLLEIIIAIGAHLDLVATKLLELKLLVQMDNTRWREV